MSAVMMEAVGLRTYETSVRSSETTRHYIPEDFKLQIHIYLDFMGPNAFRLLVSFPVTGNENIEWYLYQVLFIAFLV
jgi:hypothetical protein